jgi:hypothetical protein
MCKNAIGSGHDHFGEGINTSVLFMIGMVFAVLFSFLGVVWFSYRSGRRREERGEVFAPEGKLRWTAQQNESKP